MFFKTLRGAIQFKKSKTRLIRILSITPGGTHAWCESDQGNIRKPISAIPKGLMNDYRNSNNVV
jgi:hypothetical protein